MVEFVSPARSADPQFRDQFQSFGQRLLKLRHPSVLPLLQLGEESGRLYRVWRRRELRSACTGVPENRTAARRHLSSLMEGLLALESLGLPVDCLHVPTLSVDGDGYFVARLPFRTEIGAEQLFPPSMHRPVTALDVQVHADPASLNSSRAERFLAYLANLISQQLTGEWYSPGAVQALGDPTDLALRRCFEKSGDTPGFPTVRAALQALCESLAVGER